VASIWRPRALPKAIQKSINFSIEFFIHFGSILAPKCLPKPSKINQKSIKNGGQISASILLRFLTKIA